MSAGITAVFLCGGIGKRMFPLMEDKFMFRFLGKTLLEHQLEIARKAGIRDFVVIANPYNIERIKQVINSDNMQYAVQREPNGMADALLSAKELLLGKEILIINPNDIFESSAYENITKVDAESCILGYEVDDYFPGGYLVADGDKVKGIIEKPGKGNEPSNLVNIVVHLHRDTETLFRTLESISSSSDDVYEKSLDKIAKSGSIKVARYSGKWVPIKYPWHILAAMEHFLATAKQGIADNTKISGKATIEGNVIIDDNVRVLENAVIRGPCYIGKNSIIGNNALVRDSHIGDNCVIGNGTEIKNSYIGNNCWFHSNYIGDSVIDDNCSFGAGTVIANFRFDEQSVRVNTKNEAIDTGLDKFGAVIGGDCKTGINVSIMPGIRIGPNSFVGPNVNLTRDLEPNKMILMEPSYRIIDNKIELSGAKKHELMKRLSRL